MCTKNDRRSRCKVSFVVWEHGTQPGVGRAGQVQLLLRGASATFASCVDLRCDEVIAGPLSVDIVE